MFEARQKKEEGKKKQQNTLMYLKQPPPPTPSPLPYALPTSYLPCEFRHILLLPLQVDSKEI